MMIVLLVLLILLLLQNHQICNKENEIKSSPHSSIWKRAIKLTTSPSVKIDSTESVGELNKQISQLI